MPTRDIGHDGPDRGDEIAMIANGWAVRNAAIKSGNYARGIECD